MAQGYVSLTDKEKETLRLILCGHDAKSMAGELDLSVHTINERLRSARRKLAVTSSKEAARILLEEEAEPPYSLVYKGLGDAAHPAGEQDSGAASRRIPLWPIVTGVTAMIAALAAFAMLTPVGIPDADTNATMQTQEGTAQAAAHEWLELLDANDWAGTYARTASDFREANTLELWSETSESVRAEFGTLVSRQLLGTDDVPSPQGIRVVRYRAQYANRADVQETISLVREDGEWKVAGIYVS